MQLDRNEFILGGIGQIILAAFSVIYFIYYIVMASPTYMFSIGLSTVTLIGVVGSALLMLFAAMFLYPSIEVARKSRGNPLGVIASSLGIIASILGIIVNLSLAESKSWETGGVFPFYYFSVRGGTLSSDLGLAMLTATIVGVFILIIRDLFTNKSLFTAAGIAYILAGATGGMGLPFVGYPLLAVSGIMGATSFFKGKSA